MWLKQHLTVHFMGSVTEICSAICCVYYGASLGSYGKNKGIKLHLKNLFFLPCDLRGAP